MPCAGDPVMKKSTNKKIPITTIGLNKYFKVDIFCIADLTNSRCNKLYFSHSWHGRNYQNYDATSRRLKMMLYETPLRGKIVLTVSTIPWAGD